jgi:hypothetical protein
VKSEEQGEDSDGWEVVTKTGKLKSRSAESSHQNCQVVFSGMQNGGGAHPMNRMTTPEHLQSTMNRTITPEMQKMSDEMND